VAAAPTPRSRLPPREASPKNGASGILRIACLGNGRWRVQFGAYGSLDLAKGEWGHC
jgi:hypothetical protein